MGTRTMLRTSPLASHHLVRPSRRSVSAAEIPETTRIRRFRDAIETKFSRSERRTLGFVDWSDEREDCDEWLVRQSDREEERECEENILEIGREREMSSSGTTS